MKLDFDWRKLLPHIVAIVIFYLIGTVYFNPVLKGYKIKQGDISSFKGMSKSIYDHRNTYQEEPLWTDAMFGGMPAYQVSVVYASNVLRGFDRSVIWFASKSHGLLLLCFLSFYLLMIVMGVSPWLAIAGAIGFGLSSYFLILIEAGHNAKLHAIAYLPGVLAGLLLIYRNQLFKGGVLYGLLMSLEIYSNHVQITYYFAVLGVFLAIAYFVRSLKNKTLPAYLKQTGVIVVASILAILSNAGILWNTYTYSKETMRGGSELSILTNGEKNENKTSGLDLDYITQWSLGIAETWSLLVPEIKGGASGAVEYQKGRQTNAYWGEQPFTSGPVYVGALMFFLFVIGLFILEREFVVVTLGTMSVILLISWGHNAMWFTEFCANYLPLYNKFRAPTSSLAVIELIVPFIAILGLNKLIQKPELLKDPAIKRKLIGVTAAFAVVLLLFASIPDVFFDFTNSKEQADYASYVSQGKATNAQIGQVISDIEAFRIGVVQADALRSLLIILIGAFGIWFLLNRKRLQWIAVVVIAIVFIDLWSVDKRYVDNEKVRGKYVRWEKTKPYYYEFIPQKADIAILESERRNNPELGALISNAEQNAKKKSRKENRAFEKYIVGNEQFRVLGQNTNYRVFQLNNPFNESKTAFFHKSVGGYSAVKLSRYQDLIDFYLTSELGAIIDELQNGGKNILPVLQERKILNMLNTKYIIYNPNAAPIQNPYASGNAWFVKNIEWVDGADDEIVQLGKIDPNQTAVIDVKYKDGLATVGDANLSTGTIQLSSYKANELVYSIANPNAGVAVFSEIHYKSGWNAYADGKKIPVFRVNYLLRGLLIPANTKEVVFKFEPADFNVSESVGYAASSLLLLGLIGYLVLQFRAVKAND